MTRDTGKVAQFLGLAALAGVILAPPEVFGSGRMILVLGSTFALLILMLDGKIPARFLWIGVVGTLFLVWHAFFISIDVYRSVEFYEILWSYYCLLAVFYHTSADSSQKTAVTLILLSVMVSCYGIYEFGWGSSVDRLLISTDTGEIVRAPIAEGADSPRIMSTFAMPGTLWGFLLITLPLHAILWHNSRSLTKAGVLVSVVLLLIAGALTRNFGFVAGLVTIVLAWRLLWPGTRRRPGASIAVIGLLIVLALGIYSVRAGGYNPVSLRLQNWLTAVEIFAAYPFGAGLNNYAVAYPQHQQIGANESQYAHNTVLQLLSETGIFGLLAAGFTIWYLIRHRARVLRLVRDQKYIVVALTVWIVHNLIDINLYFASVGAVGVILMGVLGASTRAGTTVHPSLNPPWRWLQGAVGVISIAVILSSGAIYVSGELLRRAQTELSYLRVNEAHQTLRSAATINPFNSSILHEAAQVALEMYQNTGEQTYLELSKQYATRAVRLSPNKVGPHLQLALTVSNEDRVLEALAELEAAQNMHPYSRYVSSIRRLVESRHNPNPAPQTAPTP